MNTTVPKECDRLDAGIVEYIRGLRFRRKVLGADAGDLWTVVANVQRYYDEKMHDQRVEYETRLKQRDYELWKLQQRLEDGIAGGD